MEVWVTVIVAAIVALSTLCATWLQNRHSQKRFEKELERQREIDSHQWRREIRSDPLFRLRDELAIIVVKYDGLVQAADGLRNRFFKTKEDAQKEFQERLDSMNAYIQKGDFGNVLAIQYDTEIINKADEIIKDYRESYFNILNYKDSGADEQKEAIRVFKRNRDRNIELQELINKRLEEL